MEPEALVHSFTQWIDMKYVEPGVRSPRTKSQALGFRRKSSTFEWLLQKLEDIKMTR
jgi:hypothetical protein